MPPPPSGTGRVAVFAALAVAVVVLLVGAAVAFMVLRDGDEDDATPTTTTTAPTAEEEDVLLEPVAVEVPDPFSASVALGEVGLDPTVTGSTVPEAATGAAGGVVRGSAPGLYGGTGSSTSCDREQLVTFLEGQPDKAAAWAGVAGVPVRDIGTYVEELTPVLLRRDTRVLNHGFRDGRATPRTAVLQAGTAVLVDDEGIPRVKCGCGNPLDEPPPLSSGVQYRGDRWSAFDPALVVVVQVDVVLTELVLVDVVTGEPFGRPVGTDGAADVTDLSPAPTTIPPTTQRPTTTTTAPPPPATDAPDRTSEAIIAVQDVIARCADPEMGDPFQYIANMWAQEVDYELWEVEVLVTLDSGSWSAFFEVDFAQDSGGPLVRALDDASAAYLC